jgi:hypothetical protein
MKSGKQKNAKKAGSDFKSMWKDRYWLQVLLYCEFIFMKN